MVSMVSPNLQSLPHTTRMTFIVLCGMTLFLDVNDIIDIKRNLRVEECNLWYVNIECAMWIWHSTLQIEVTKISKKRRVIFVIYKLFTYGGISWSIAREISVLALTFALPILIKFANSAVRNNQRYKILCRFLDENRIFPYSWNSIPDDWQVTRVG